MPNCVKCDCFYKPSKGEFEIRPKSPNLSPNTNNLEKCFRCDCYFQPSNAELKSLELYKNPRCFKDPHASGDPGTKTLCKAICTRDKCDNIACKSREMQVGPQNKRIDARGEHRDRETRATDYASGDRTCNRGTCVKACDNLKCRHRETQAGPQNKKIDARERKDSVLTAPKSVPALNTDQALDQGDVEVASLVKPKKQGLFSRVFGKKKPAKMEAMAEVDVEKLVKRIQESQKREQGNVNTIIFPKWPELPSSVEDFVRLEGVIREEFSGIDRNMDDMLFAMNRQNNEIQAMRETIDNVVKSLREQSIIGMGKKERVGAFLNALLSRKSSEKSLGKKKSTTSLAKNKKIKAKSSRASLSSKSSKRSRNSLSSKKSPIQKGKKPKKVKKQNTKPRRFAFLSRKASEKKIKKKSISSLMTMKKKKSKSKISSPSKKSSSLFSKGSKKRNKNKSILSLKPMKKKKSVAKKSSSHLKNPSKKSSSLFSRGSKKRNKKKSILFLKPMKKKKSVAKKSSSHLKSPSKKSSSLFSRGSKKRNKKKSILSLKSMKKKKSVAKKSSSHSKSPSKKSSSLFSRGSKKSRKSSKKRSEKKTKPRKLLFFICGGNNKKIKSK